MEEIARQLVDEKRPAANAAGPRLIEISPAERFEFIAREAFHRTRKFRRLAA